MKGFKWIIPVAFVVLFSFVRWVSSAELAIGNGTRNSSTGDISFALTLTAEAGEDIAGVNLEIHPISNLSVNAVTAGQAAVAGEKEVAYHSPSTGVLRLVIYGINQTLIPNGTLAVLTFTVVDPSQQNIDIDIASADMASPDAQAVPISTMQGFTGTVTDLATTDNTSAGKSNGCFISSLNDRP